MKTSLLVVSAILISAFTSAQNINKDKVPANVKSTFTSKFPSAKNAKWEKEKENYEVSFLMEKTEQSALLDATGKLIETEIVISRNQLPKNIESYLASHYPSKKITETSKITDAKGVTTFEVEVKGKDLIFDTNGTFIKEVTE